MEDFSYYNSLNELDAESIHLVQLATNALELSYAPYSGFQVGTAVLLTDGSIVLGANQENAAYPSCMCAERVALYTVSSQHPGATIKKIAVVARRANTTALVPATSCGTCRQVMLEFEDRQKADYEVIMFTQNLQWVKTKSAAALLPFNFSRSALKEDLS